MRRGGTGGRVLRDGSLGSKAEYFKLWCNVKRAAVLAPLWGAGSVHPPWASPADNLLFFTGDKHLCLMWVLCASSWARGGPFHTSKVWSCLRPSSLLPMSSSQLRSWLIQITMLTDRDPNLQTRSPQTIQAAFSAVSKPCLPVL